MGVTTNSDTGKLEFDGTKLDAALADNPDSVISFFAAEDSGFATRMDGMLAGYLDSDGVIDSIIDGANSRIKDISRSRESLERRLESTEQRYLQQFSALDSLMANMNSTSDYLASQLDALSNLTINRNK
jgi:flagellar hook-associated protein 2